MTTSIDTRYFTRNASFLKEDFGNFQEQDFLSDLISEIERFHPDGDISLLDIERLAVNLIDDHDITAVLHGEPTVFVRLFAKEIWNAIEI